MVKWSYNNCDIGELVINEREFSIFVLPNGGFEYYYFKLDEKRENILESEVLEGKEPWFVPFNIFFRRFYHEIRILDWDRQLRLKK